MGTSLLNRKFHFLMIIRFFRIQDRNSSGDDGRGHVKLKMLLNEVKSLLKNVHENCTVKKYCRMLMNSKERESSLLTDNCVQIFLVVFFFFFLKIFSKWKL